MFLFEIVFGVIVSIVFFNYIMFVFFGSDFGIVFGVKNMKFGILYI